MSKKLYSAIFLGISVFVAKESGASVDLFNNPVGAIGEVKQPDLFNNPVGQIGVPAAPAADSKPAAVQASTPQPGQSVQPAEKVAPVAVQASTTPQPGQNAHQRHKLRRLRQKTNRLLLTQQPRRKKSKHWSYQPIKAPAQPMVNNTAWVRTPIDAFVLAPLEAKGITPSPDADRAAFVRRATLDAWGVIPTPEDVAAFVNDTSPDAYEKLADRLLSSPKYGERQARRWLDLARYADSSGFPE